LAGGFLAQRLFVQRGEISQQRLPVMGSLEALYQRVDGERQGAILVHDSNKMLLGELLSQKERGAASFPYRDTIHWFPAQRYPHAIQGTSGVVGELPVSLEPAVRKTIEVARAVIDSLPPDYPAFVRMFRQRGGLGGAPERAPWPEKPPWTEVERPALGSDYRAMVGVRADAAGGRWEELAREMSGPSAEYAALRSRIVPKSLYCLLALLLAMLVAGVVVPLSRLSASDGSSKTVLLVSFGVLAVLFVLYFVYELWKLQAAAKLENETF
jgi:hypothetical protein